MQQQVNLYHPIFRKQEKKFSAKAMLQAATAVVAGILVMYAYSAWQLNSLRQQSGQLERELASATTRVSELATQAASRPADPALVNETKRLEALVDMSQRIRSVLQSENLGNSRGFSNHLAAFARQHIPGVWLTGVSFKGSGSDLTVEGRTYEPELVPRYLQKLTSEAPLAGAQFQTFVMNRPELQPNAENKGASKSKNAGSDKALANYVEFLVKTDINEEKVKKP